MKLKPCPFCGQVPQITEMEERGFTYKMIYCETYDCPVDTSTPRFYETDEEAAEAWNTRPAETALLARVREKIEAEKVGANKDDDPSDRAWDRAISRAIRAVDEVEKEARG